MNTQIYIIGGKARAGKDTVAAFIKEEMEKEKKKHLNIQYSFYIKEYANSNDAGRVGDNTRRDRKLLLHKVQIQKLKKQIEQERLTLVPLKAYFSGSNLKIELAVARGKKLTDKRETLKTKQIERDLRRQN